MICTKRLGTFAAGIFATLLLFVQASPGAVGVGDQPKLAFRSTDGAKISLDQLKGKLVIVDFWATWCGPCMAAAPHLAELNNKYGPQGLQMIGISLDEDKAAMIATAKEKGLVWPQYVDGQGGPSFAGPWGVDSIPQTFLIGPDGKVLWTGDPGEIDGPLEKAFKEHPPVLVDPSVLADAKAKVSAARAALKAGDTRAALAAMAKVPAPARADKAFAADADAVGKELESAANRMLAEVDPLIAAKQYIPAVTRLRELSAALNSMPAGAQARRKLTELEAKPEVKAEIAKAARADQARGLFDAALAWKTAKKDEQAYARLKAVAAEFPDTPAGAKAGEVLKAYERDSAFVKRVNESAAAGKATSLLNLAQSYASAGRSDLARNKLQQVIAQFPGTSYADRAKKAMAALGQ